ncbi:MAG TPA: hypothetical protein VM261_29590 [Kofleriaceae bacterium]|nr:hypothetical protein [Kofleriaceae bacterium]
MARDIGKADVDEGDVDRVGGGDGERLGSRPDGAHVVAEQLEHLAQRLSRVAVVLDDQHVLSPVHHRFPRVSSALP